MVDYQKYKVRTVRMYPHECALCHSAIHLGEKYHDGGYGKRVHVKCPPIPCDCDQCKWYRKDHKATTTSRLSSDKPNKANAPQSIDSFEE